MIKLLMVLMLCLLMSLVFGCTAENVDLEGDDSNKPEDSENNNTVGDPYEFPFNREGIKITLTDMVGQEKSLEGEAVNAVINILEKATFEIDEMPEGYGWWYKGAAFN